MEPGTPAAGWRHIRRRAPPAHRRRSCHLLAPCPHAAACPLSAPDGCPPFCPAACRAPECTGWPRSAPCPWGEDEEYIYVAASRKGAAAPAGARVLSPPQLASGRVLLKLCQGDGTAAGSFLPPRRQGEKIFKDSAPAPPVPGPARRSVPRFLPLVFFGPTMRRHRTPPRVRAMKTNRRPLGRRWRR